MFVRHGIECDCCSPLTDEEREQSLKNLKRASNPSVKYLKNRIKFLKKQIRNANRLPSKIILNISNKDPFAIVLISGKFYKLQNRCVTHGLSIPVSLPFLMKADLVVDQDGVVYKTLPNVAEVFQNYFNNLPCFMEEHVIDLTNNTLEEIIEIFNNNTRELQFLVNFVETVNNY